MNPASFTVTVRVRPGARKSEITGKLADGSMKISVAAPAEDGAANEELIRFLAEHYGVSKSAISLLSGKSSGKKVVKIRSE